MFYFSDEECGLMGIRLSVCIDDDDDASTGRVRNPFPLVYSAEYSTEERLPVLVVRVSGILTMVRVNGTNFILKSQQHSLKL